MLFVSHFEREQSKFGVGLLERNEKGEEKVKVGREYLSLFLFDIDTGTIIPG